MCWQWELTRRQGNGGMTLLLMFSEVIKKCWKLLWGKAGRMEGILLSSLPSLESLGFGEAHPLPLTPSSKLHHYWAQSRDIHWLDKPERRNIEIAVSSPPANKTWEDLFFLPCLIFFFSHLLLKKKISISKTWLTLSQYFHKLMACKAVKSNDWNGSVMLYICQVSEQPVGLSAWIHSSKKISSIFLPSHSSPQFICKLTKPEFTMPIKIQSPAVDCILIRKCILTCIYYFTELSVAEQM